MGLADNPGPDDEFFAHMREQLNSIAIPNENNVAELGLIELLRELQQTNDRLRAIGEMHHPKTQEGRELHSRRAALTIEKNRREP